jgi:putative ABC transport system permease protein
MDLAIHDLNRHKGRFIATVIGVGLLFAVVLSFNGIYRGFLEEGLSFIKTTNADLWVVERNKGGPINEQSILPEFYHYSVAAMAGVAQASPLIYFPVEREIQGKKRRFAVIGYDVFGGLGGPQDIVAGRGISQAHYEMVAHQKLGVKVGDMVNLGLHTYRVVGLTSKGSDVDGEPLVYLSLPDAQEVLFQRDNEEIRNQRQRLWQSLTRSAGFSPAEADKYLPRLLPDTHIINAVVVKLAPGADAEAVSRQIQKWLYLSVYTTDQQINLMLQGKLAKPKAQTVLFRIILFTVSIVIISLVIYTFTMEKIRSIAVMKLIGAPNWAIIRMVLEESLLLTCSSFLVGLILISNTYQFFPRRVVLLPGDHLMTLLIALLGAILASGLGVRQALKTEPALALGGQ